MAADGAHGFIRLGLRQRPARSSALTRTEPLVFGDHPPLLGVLTIPEQRADDKRGVVVCAPLFHQNICSYRPLRNLAVRVAELGWPVLRFDWPNCGDSGDAAIESITAYTAVVQDALDVIREDTGVSEVTLIGLRFGATLALLGALADQSVSGLVLLAPFASGRSYLRDLRVFEAMVQDQFSEPDVPAPPLPEGAMEAGGFLLSPAEVDAIASVDLLAVDFSPLAGRHVLVAAAQPDRGVSGLVDALGSGGLEVEYAEVGELARAWDGTLTSFMPGPCTDLVRRWLLGSVATTTAAHR